MTELIQQFGIFGVFLLMVPESACIPVPSEVTLLFCGFAVGRHLMSLPLAILAATAGNVVGSLIAYAVGASRVLAGVPGAQLLMKRSERMLDDRGLRAVFLARLLPLARTFVSLPAGARRLPLMPFIALTTVGCALWATALVIVGLVSGTAWGAVSSVVGKAMLGISIVVVLALVHKRGVAASRTRRYAVSDQPEEALR